MKEELERLENLAKKDDIKDIDMKNILITFLKTHVKANKIENYIGDFPTFIEPVYLGENVEIGDDVLLGPNIYVGNNCKIGDYAEISNSVILDNVKLGSNFILENCIIAKNSKFNFNNLNVKNYVLRGIADSKEDMKKIQI